MTITLGDQGNRSFWQDVKRTLPPLDIFVDDGGHSMRQQIVTFEEMFPHVKDGGTYLCEDTHTSYWPKLEGGYRKEGTWIEYSKKFVDTIHLGPSKKLNLTVGVCTVPAPLKLVLTDAPSVRLDCDLATKKRSATIRSTFVVSSFMIQWFSLRKRLHQP